MTGITGFIFYSMNTLIFIFILNLVLPYCDGSSRRARSDNGCMGLLVNPCRCSPPNTSTTVECIDAKFTDLDMEYFQTVGSGHFHTLRHVTFHGNSFTHLPPYMFGFYVDNIAGLESLNLSKNAFVNISSEAFCGMKNLGTLDLSDNQIELVSDDDETLSLFRSIGKSLKYLKLHNAFGQPIDSATQSGRLKRSFELAEFRRLHFLDLSSNNFDFLPYTFLCPLKDLRNFDLSDNRLTTLNFDPNCFKNLHTFDLSRNYLTTLDSTFVSTVGGLKSDYSLRLSNNLFECNCESRDYLEWIDKNSVKIKDVENLICLKASPKKFAGKSSAEEVIFNLDDLDCDNPVTANAFSILYNFHGYGFVMIFWYFWWIFVMLL